MSNTELFPTCEHIDCEHMQRVEYCEIEARDPNESAGVTIAMIDHLMYVQGDFERGIEYTYDDDKRYISREFSHVMGDIQTWAWPLIESKVSMLHESNTANTQHTYYVKVGWRSTQQDASTNFYETTYTIEPWPAMIFGTVEEYELSTEQFYTHEKPKQVSRQMTNYDHETLYKVLRDIDNIRVAEARDDALSLKS